MDVRVADLTDLEEALEQGIDRIGELRAGTRVDSDDFFAESFMREHTDYDTFGAFRADAPVDLDVPLDDQPSIDVDRLDEYVRGTTEFASWERMQTTAAEEKIIDQLVTDTA